MNKTFSLEMRLEAIRLHEEENLSVVEIAKKFGTCHSVVERWLDRYKYNGIEGLKIKNLYQQYNDDFKKTIIDLVTNQKCSKTKVAAMYGLSEGTIRKWVLKSKGINVSQKKNLITAEEAAAIREKFKHIEDPEIRKILEKKYWLELENEALKKLQALTQNQQKKK